MIEYVKNLIFLIIGLAFIAGCLYIFLNSVKIENSRLKIGDKSISVEVADDDFERAKGLSGRTSLKDGHGLLFIFPKKGLHGFWMKDMRFPIDIIWLDDELKIVEIARNIDPATFPQTFYPPIPIKYVVETNPGEL